MKLFLKKIMIYGILAIGISLLVDGFISRELKKSTSFAFGESEIWHTIYEGNLDANLVIYGSSRAWVHIDPQMIEDSLQVSAYNLGIDGHNFWLQYLRHKELLKHNETPKTIILTVGPFTLRKRNDLYNYEQFLPYIFKQDVRDFTKSYEGFSKLDYYLPLFRFRGQKDALKHAMTSVFSSERPASYRVKGYRGRNRTWNDDLEKAKSKMKSFHIDTNSETVTLFETFFKECKTLGINLVMVYAPEYIEGQRFIENRQEVLEIYQTMNSKYEAPFLDYSQDDICKDKTLFYNSMHLNIKGSKRFTHKLINDLKTMDIF